MEGIWSNGSFCFALKKNDTLEWHFIRLKFVSLIVLVHSSFKKLTRTKKYQTSYVLKTFIFMEHINIYK